jgi:tRNA threonylcarbamoyladenosine biosynthesis protein TsaB
LEVYTAIFDSKYSCIEPTSAKILDAKSYNKILKSNSVYFVGNATQKTNAIINHKNAVFSEQLPSASQMCSLSHQKFEAKIFEDTAYFEPYYLKDFVAFPSKK